MGLVGIMLNFQELANRLAACANGQIPVEDFEDWFDENSWNVHQQQNQGLVDAVFQVEALFSAHQSGLLNQQSLLQKFRELQGTVRPFGGCISRVVFLPNRHAELPAQSLSSEWTVLEECIVLGTRTGGNSTVIPLSACKDYPFLHSENSTRVWRCPSSAPV
jgi:hypothetical protein